MLKFKKNEHTNKQGKWIPDTCIITPFSKWELFWLYSRSKQKETRRF